MSRDNHDASIGNGGIGDDGERGETEPEQGSRQQEYACTQVAGFSNYLLLNTQNGMCLTTRQIGTVFQQFLTNHDASLKGITTKSIRPSYATMMFRGWLAKKIHRDKNEAQFFQHMAMLMNTSVEQLKSTYVSIDRGDYDKTVRGMVAAFTDMAEEERDHVENENEKENDYENDGDVEIDKNDQRDVWDKLGAECEYTRQHLDFDGIESESLDVLCRRKSDDLRSPVSSCYNRSDSTNDSRRRLTGAILSRRRMVPARRGGRSGKTISEIETLPSEESDVLGSDEISKQFDFFD